VCSEVLEHVDRPRELLANAAAYLAPGCRLVVTVPGGADVRL
jgi:2-polyprenyl-3-methyl-5-hydroxy-6-metoxy-1,4-benzoquinol methylase